MSRGWPCADVGTLGVPIVTQVAAHPRSAGFQVVKRTFRSGPGASFSSAWLQTYEPAGVFARIEAS